MDTDGEKARVLRNAFVRRASATCAHAHSDAPAPVCVCARVYVSVRGGSRSTRSRESPTADGWRHSAGCYRCLRTSVAIYSPLSAASD